MRYQFYIADILRGAVEGTNDGLLAHQLARREGCLVIDIRTGERLFNNGDRLQVGSAEGAIDRHNAYAQFRKNLRDAHVKLHERSVECHKVQDGRHAGHGTVASGSEA